MTTTRGQQILLVASFLVAVFVVPIAQAVIEFRQGKVPQILDLVRHAPTVANLRAFEEDLENQSWFARTLRPRMQYVVLRAFADGGEKALVGRHGWWFYRPGVRYLVEAPATDMKDKTGDGQVVSAIISFRDQLAARGINLLVVPVPGKASIYPEMLTLRAAKADPRVHGHTRLVIDRLAMAGIEVVDLFDAFVRARTGISSSASSRYYLPRDTHWTPAGLRLAAQAAAQRIRDLGWGEPGTHAYETRPVLVKRKSDIVQMLQAPQIEGLFTADVVQCEQVISSASGEPYRDDPRARILVLGDSFLRIYEGDEPGSAGFIAHLAHQLGQPVTSVVNDGGASTLVRQELARKPQLLAGKTLVLWEFVERDIRFGLGGWQDVPLPPMAVPLSSPAGVRRLRSGYHGRRAAKGGQTGN